MNFKIEAACVEIGHAISDLKTGNDINQHLHRTRGHLQDLIEISRKCFVQLPFALKEERRNAYFSLGLLYDVLMFTPVATFTPENLEGFEKLLKCLANEPLFGGDDDSPLPFIEYRKLLTELGMSVTT